MEKINKITRETKLPDNLSFDDIIDSKTESDVKWKEL